MEQVTGFEPVIAAWQAAVLPLYYTCLLAGNVGVEPTSNGSEPFILADILIPNMVQTDGLEPPTLCL